VVTTDEDMFQLLRMAITAMQRDDESDGENHDDDDDEEENGHVRPAVSREEPKLIVQECARILETGEESDDEESDEEDQVSLDGDMCQNKLAAALLDAPVGVTIMVGLEWSGKFVVAEEDAAGGDVTAHDGGQPASHKRLSAAERRRLKKSGKKKNQAVTPQEPVSNKPPATDMFRTATKPSLAMVVTLHKQSEHLLAVVTDQDTITSYGEALQTLLSQR